LRLNRDFHELLECFARNDVRYLIIGGWAMAAHGVQRMTKDLDVWVLPDADNSHAVIAALEEFEFKDLGLSPTDFLTPETVIQLGYPPNRVDLLVTPSGVDFEECWQEHIEIDVDGLLVPFIGLEGLKTNKRAVGRTQDLADIEALELG
jgi:hypothetical protein